MKTTEIYEMILEKWREANDYPFGEDYVRRWMIDILACNNTDDLQELASILEFI